MNFLLVKTKTACGTYETLSYSLSQQKIFFGIFAIIFGIAYLVIGVYNKKRFTFATTIIAFSFCIFLIILSFLNFKISNETFYLVFTCCSGNLIYFHIN